jgi:integrase
MKFLEEIDRSRNPNVGGIVRLMLGLGLRENEALNARWEHLNLRGKTYQPPKTRGGKAPFLSVPDWLVDVLKKLQGKETEGWMFPSVDGKPHRANFTQKPIHRAGKSVGLINLTPHRLRATFATMHVEAGTPLPKVQRMLGHSEISTTMRYVEDSTAGLREAQARVAEAMGFAVRSKGPIEAKAKGGKVGGKKRTTPPQTQ